MTNIEFARLVAKYRAMYDVRLVDLSAKTDLSLTTLVKIEKNGACLLRNKILIAKALNFSREDLEKVLNSK